MTVNVVGQRTRSNVKNRVFTWLLPCLKVKLKCRGQGQRSGPRSRHNFNRVLTEKFSGKVGVLTVCTSALEMHLWISLSAVAKRSNIWASLVIHVHVYSVLSGAAVLLVFLVPRKGLPLLMCKSESGFRSGFKAFWARFRFRAQKVEAVFGFVFKKNSADSDLDSNFFKLSEFYSEKLMDLD